MKNYLSIVLTVVIFISFLLASGNAGTRKKVGSILRSKSFAKMGRYSHRPGLSSNEKRILFAGAGALAGVYISSKMRSLFHRHSYPHNLEVCPGKPYLTENTSEQYKHFVCPQDPLESHRRYCCWDSLTSSGVCCSRERKYYPSTSQTSIWTTALVILIIIVTIALLFYCYQRRKKRRSMTGKPEDFFPTAPAQPVTVSSPNPNVPFYPGPPPNQIGSAWAQQSNWPPTEPPRDPPPPYPIN